MVIDILAQNNWERPVYFAITVGGEAFQNLSEFFRLDGLVYKVVPVKTVSRDGERGYVDTDVLYDSYMNKFSWGGIDNKNVYLDENNLRMLTNIKSGFLRLGEALYQERKLDKVKEVLDHCYAVMPTDLVTPTFYDLSLGALYYKIGEEDRAKEILNLVLSNCKDELKYFVSLDSYQQSLIEEDFYRSAAIGHEVVRMARENKDEVLRKSASNDLLEILKQYPILSSLTMQAIESQDFMRVYQTFSDFEKQLVSIFLALTENLE